MSHLGDRLVALIDGELDHDSRDKVLAHLAVCQECRAEAEAQRRLKGVLTELDAPSPSAAFLDRLRALAEPGEPVPPAPPGGPGGGGSAGTVGFAAGSGGTAFAGSRRPGIRRTGFAVGGLFCLAAAAATTAFVVGDRYGDGTGVVPPVDQYTVEHAVTVPSVPLTGPAGEVAAPVPADTAPVPTDRVP